MAESSPIGKYNQQLLANQTGSPRRSWSSIAFQNKNFPDGKLGYETNNLTNNNSIGTDDTGKSKYFDKGMSKFERSSQDVMARASQIVQ